MPKMDKWDKEKRSEVMAKIHGKDTKPEIWVRKYLFSKGFRYRKNVKDILGKPDIVLSKYKTVIFIHGCFWHGHDVDGRIPLSNIEFWTQKIQRNKERDFKIKRELEHLGWRVIIVWECEISTIKKRDKTLPALCEKIKSNKFD